MDSHGEVKTDAQNLSSSSAKADLYLQPAPSGAAAVVAGSSAASSLGSLHYFDAAAATASSASETLLRSEDRHVIRSLPLRSSERLYNKLVKMAQTKKEDQHPFQGFYHLPLLITAGTLCFVFGSFIERHVPKGKARQQVFAMFLCGMYVACSASVGVCIKVLSDHAKQKKIGGSASSYTFDPLCLVVITEISKLFITSVLLGVTRLTRRAEDSQPQSLARLSTADLYHFAAPAACFTLGNFLAFAAIGANDVSVYGVFQNTMLLWTTAFWKIRFRAELGWGRSAAVVLCFSGLCLNQAAHVSMDGGRFGTSVGWILLMTQSNSLGAVLNEHALKRSMEVDINIQNMLLYSICFLCSIVLLLWLHPAKIRSTADFFNGFSSLSWTLAGLQACSSLLVSRLLKHADSIMKTFATCMQGPVLMVVAPFFVKSSLSRGHVMSTIVVTVGCCWYLLQGPLDKVEETSPLSSKLEEQKPPTLSLDDCFLVRQDRSNKSIS